MNASAHAHVRPPALASQAPSAKRPRDTETKTIQNRRDTHTGDFSGAELVARAPHLQVPRPHTRMCPRASGRVSPHGRRRSLTPPTARACVRTTHTAHAAHAAYAFGGAVTSRRRPSGIIVSSPSRHSWPPTNQHSRRAAALSPKPARVGSGSRAGGCDRGARRMSEVGGASGGAVRSSSESRRPVVATGGASRACHANRRVRRGGARRRARA
jgi:hypothetical protein